MRVVLCRTLIEISPPDNGKALHESLSDVARVEIRFHVPIARNAPDRRQQSVHQQLVGHRVEALLRESLLGQ